MKEHPILFSGPMVRAILEGRKTQTRRVVKPQPPDEILRHPDGLVQFKGGGSVRCPYGQPGGMLWVRETWYQTSDKKQCLGYPADGDNPHGFAYRIGPSIHLPRKFSRLTLRITDVRVQRVQEITKADVIAEGITEREGYPLFWDSINAKRGYSWDSNPWVWALTFEKVSA